MAQSDSYYLHDIPLDQAWQRFEQSLESAGLNGVLGSEEADLDERLVGRVTTAPVWALTSSRSTAKGYAACPFLWMILIMKSKR